ncbi:uncharacterized protein LOC134235136 [Saccostrea cucullata]|uniref:uncharacterized protein LOC134235136 n=1 Tax=Saccostrea cuccullata TaxID=36930 RepID=UPI002ED4D8B5
MASAQFTTHGIMLEKEVLPFLFGVLFSTIAGRTLGSVVAVVVVCYLFLLYLRKQKQDVCLFCLTKVSQRNQPYFKSAFSFFPTPIKLPVTLESLFTEHTYKSVLEIDVIEDTDSGMGRGVCRFLTKDTNTCINDRRY